MEIRKLKRRILLTVMIKKRQQKLNVDGNVISATDGILKLLLFKWLQIMSHIVPQMDAIIHTNLTIAQLKSLCLSMQRYD